MDRKLEEDRVKEFKSFYKKVKGNEGQKCHYPTRLDTYGCGCAHDCSYCYAKSLLDFRGLWHPEDPAVANIDAIRRAVSRIPKGETVRLGGMTDCFQQIEHKERVTYETIKALNERGVHYLIVTKSPMVAEDEYMAILDKDLAHIQITVTTLNDKLSATYEKAAPPSVRIKAILKLQDAGYDVQLRLSPFIPQNVDFDALAKTGVHSLVVEFLRVNYWVRKWFDLDFSEYTVQHGGYAHLPLQKKAEYIGKLSNGPYTITVCDDEDEAYAFWRDYFNPNPDDCCNLRR